MTERGAKGEPMTDGQLKRARRDYTVALERWNRAAHIAAQRTGALDSWRLDEDWVRAEADAEAAALVAAELRTRVTRIARKIAWLEEEGDDD